MPTDRSAIPHPDPLEWVVIANAARARVFERDADNGAMREIADHLHPASRQKGTELDDARPGRAAKGAASTAFAPHTDSHEREHEHFARELAQMLESAALEHRMPALWLLASNPFLGVLKAHLSPATQKVLKVAVPLDLTAYQFSDLEHRVTQALRDAG